MPKPPLRKGLEPLIELGLIEIPLSREKNKVFDFLLFSEMLYRENLVLKNELRKCKVDPAEFVSRRAFPIGSPGQHRKVFDGWYVLIAADLRVSYRRTGSQTLLDLPTLRVSLIRFVLAPLHSTDRRHQRAAADRLLVEIGFFARTSRLLTQRSTVDQNASLSSRPPPARGVLPGFRRATLSPPRRARRSARQVFLKKAFDISEPEKPTLC
jgi:hypothetical protein